jgi:hypothetical protein
MAGVGVVAEAAGAGLGEENLTVEELGMQIFRQEEQWRWPWWCAHRQVQEETSAGTAYAVMQRECCLLVLNLVSSTLSCIRHERPRLLVLDVCGFV